MFHVLRAYFEQRFPLTDDQFEMIRSLYIHRHLQKGEFLIREGEVAKYGAFIANGCLRKYIIDNKGKEHILQFLPENWWVADVDGLMHGKPCAFFVEALEDSDVLLTDKASNQKVMQEIPGFAEAYTKGLQKHAQAKDKRIASAMSASAEERYNDFLSTYPTIPQRVPQHMIASYLGISPETLSRIRKKQSLRK